MKKVDQYIALLCCLFSMGVFAQQNSEVVINGNEKMDAKTYDFDERAPAKAAFYSAIFPGLGQIYNKKYWYIKLPVIYASLGTGVYNYSFNNNNYNRLRRAYQNSINGLPHEFDGTGNNIFLSDDSMISAQRTYKNNRDLSLIITAGIYILQILEANVAAHLLHHNVNDDLSIRPTFIQQDQTNMFSFGTALTYKF